MFTDPDTIAMIYEAAALPDQWAGVLTKLGVSVDAPAAGLVSIDRNGTTRALTTDTYAGVYERYAAVSRLHPNVRAERYLAAGHVGFMPDLDLCTRAELAADPIYVQALYPEGFAWTIGAPVSSPSEDLMYFDFGRRRGADPFGNRDVQFLNAYRPHLSRAALMSTRLGLERARAAADTLSVIGLPGGVIAENGRVLAANALLEKLSPRIAIGAFDRVTIEGSAANALLYDALQAGEASLKSVGSIPMPASGIDPAMVVHLIPVQRAAHDIFLGATFIMIVVIVVAAGGPQPGLLSALYDLTPAEAKVARAIVAGETIAQMARRTMVSVETVRNQLKSVLGKTGTRRQVELIRLLLAATPLGDGSRQQAGDL